MRNPLKKYNYIILLLLNSLLIPNDIGLIKNLKFIDGLSSNNITEISIDNDNRAWIGTYNGISMYNGNHFINLFNSDSLSNKNINTIYSSKNNIWFGTNDGMYKISENEDNFIVENYINYKDGIYDIIKKGEKIFCTSKNKLI